MCRVTITASRPGASPWILPPARLSLLRCCFGTAPRAVHRYQLSNCLHCQPHRTVLATNLLWLKQVSARLPGVAYHESLCVTSHFSACWDTLMFDHDVGGYSDMVISFAIIPQTCIFYFSSVQYCSFCECMWPWVGDSCGLFFGHTLNPFSCIVNNL